ncbi:MAG: ABC transporter permease [Anaerolineae bacterium]
MIAAPKRSTTQTKKAAPFSKMLVLLLAVLIAIGMTLFVTVRIFGGDPATVIENMTQQTDYQAILFVNALIGLSVCLFIIELRGIALRVTFTVIVALVFGFLMTMFFNWDTASRFIRGEFRVQVVSEAAPVENDSVDMQYNRARGDEFNKENAREPLHEVNYTFEGHQGDVVTVLVYAANRRSTVDLEGALLAPDGSSIGSGSSATEAQVDQYDDLQSTNDAVIENVTLPADGVYTIHAQPQEVSFGTTLNEALSSTETAYQAFLLGPLGRVNRWAVWIQDALTLILVGLAISIVFRARQFSLGAEGQLYFGALVSGMIALASGNLPVWLVIPIALIGAMTAGFLWGLLPGILKAYLGANELVSTLMLNAIATRFYEMVLTFQLKPPDAGYTSSADFPASGQLPVIVDGTQVTIAVFVVIIAVIAVWLLMTRTPLGYEIRTVGNNLKFANYGGINTKRTIMLAMAVSGIVAGLAGAHLAMGIHRMLILNISIGLAFEGVVVALLARNNPLVIPFTGLLYAYLRSGAQFMERDANVSFEVVRIIQAVIILLITADALLSFLQTRRAVALPETPQKPTSTMESARLILESSEKQSHV